MTETAAPQSNTSRNLKGAALAAFITFVCGWEGFQAVGWHDPIDPPGVNTVCYGHIEDVQIGEKHTKMECQQMLAEDLPRYEAQVAKCIHVAMPDYRHMAILSFDYNVGGGALCKSSVARKLNAGDVQGGCDALLLYNKANGKVIKGLQNRREAERKLCLRNDNVPANTNAGPVSVQKPVTVREQPKPKAQDVTVREQPKPKAPVSKPVIPSGNTKPAAPERTGFSYFLHTYILGW